MDDERLIDIETKLAHQEHMLAALNEALSNQQVQITDLERLCQSLADRIRALSEAGAANAGDDKRPPHY